MTWTSRRSVVAMVAFGLAGCYVGVDGATDPTQASAASEASGDPSTAASEGSTASTDASAGTSDGGSTSGPGSTGVDPSDASSDASTSGTGDITTGDITTVDPTTSSTGATTDPTTSTSTSTSTTSTTGGTTGGDPFDALAQTCVDEINMYRATEGLPPYTRWMSAEMCADGEAESDAMTNTPHGAFPSCGEFAQNECPGWPAGDLAGSLKGCLAQMWAEGPGMDFNMHGHYINMSSTQYSQVACGFYITGGNKLWAVQDFK